MATGTIRTRETGATARLGRVGQPEIVSATGGTLTVATRPSEPGFNPLDLLHASLSACLVLSARIAASELGLLDRFRHVEVSVAGDKLDGPARIGTFRIRIVVEGELGEAEKAEIIARAEAICTVSNTLKSNPRFELAEG